MKTEILFVGHVPPPWTGQGVVHQIVLQGDYSEVRLVHLPMRFSNISAAQGKISVMKILALLRLILRTYQARFQKRIVFLYFSPGGPVTAAVLRDGIYLLAVRPIMRGTMLVYHSSGVAEFIENLPPVIRPLIKAGFSGARLAIQLSSFAPPDGAALQAQETRIIPNALPDDAGPWFPRKQDGTLRILYMGVVAIGKGVRDLLLAAHELFKEQIPFRLMLAGDFRSADEESELRQLAKGLPRGSVEFTGSLSGEAKKEAFRSNDVFCFPSFWHAETFPLVLLEALAFGMPVVASRWRGIPDLLGTDGSCGSLVDIHAIDQLSAALERLAREPTLREAMSRNARLRYEERFRLDQFYVNYNEAFSVLTSQGDARQ
jgi:glycosyltransferase involved in cell wall biosynthesis